MTFTTLTFFVFGALAFAVYWGLRARRAQNVFLIVASYVFYGWWDWRFCGLIALSSAIDWVVGLALERSGRRRLLLGVSVVANLGLLGTFKYYDFFVESFVAAAGALGLSLQPSTLHVVLPVGISFYTFQTLSTTIDVYRRETKACRDPIDYFAFVSFFPQLVAGPIERGAKLLPQFAAERRFDPRTARAGLRQALWGLVQKVVLADNLAVAVDTCYDATCGGPMTLIATIAFAFQIYWDFAGYSNIAIGTARLFGFSLSRNFAYPYFSRSIAEFWRRWHISLSTWFRDYVYVPLGGNRRGRGRQIASVLATFTLSGLWHGASWTFVVWGLLHGLLAVPGIVGRRRRIGPDSLAGSDGRWPSVGDAAHMLGTFALVCLAWVFFRARSLPHAWTILSTIARDFADPNAWADLGPHADYLQGVMPLVAMFVIVEWLTRAHEHPLQLDRWPRWSRWLLYTILLWSALFMAPEDPTRFVYFQF